MVGWPVSQLYLMFTVHYYIGMVVPWRYCSVQCLIIETTTCLRVTNWRKLYIGLSVFGISYGITHGTKILHGIKFYGFMVSGRTIKLKSINWMEIYYTIATTSNTNLSFIKLTFNLNHLEANRKRFVPYSVIEYTNSIFLQSITSTMRQTVVSEDIWL